MTHRISTTLIAMLASIVVLASCGKDNDGRNHLMGDITDPGWSVAAGYDYSTSMTVVASVSLQADAGALEVAPADCLAAFVGDECVGLANPVDTLFFLYIVAPQTEGSGSIVSLRYYSSQLRNIFTSDLTFPFINGSQQGTASSPLNVAF